MTPAITPPASYDWRTITALNIVSALAQVGQFGILYVIVPVWLAEQGLNAAQLGFFAASLWMGQLPGLALAPALCRSLGPRRVVIAGLLCTLVALFGLAVGAWPVYLLCGVLAGFGMGLRWIGLEPWLYHIAPAHARGRLVGFHETLIAAAPVVAPVIAGQWGVQGNTVLWVGASFTVSALVPLALARRPPVADDAHTQPSWSQSLRSAYGYGIFRAGLAIALFGGMLESAVVGLFAIFAQDRSFAVGEVTQLLTAFGLGGFLLQYPVGWLADHWGLKATGVVCAAGTGLLAAALAMLPGSFLAYGGMFALGGLITGFLTLALVAATKTPTADMARNVSALSMVYSLSAVVGPIVAGWAMTATHSQALMWFAACVAVLMGFVLVYQSQGVLVVDANASQTR
ncbi:MFS transporter [Rhodoferax aquaticus]|uniref:MFS transporter n=1 Tax=Rhodoferax aquaticus TaxID=2527691 RepID=A0A515ELR2_9BURK|nr:MFS transporter [Rhodoferax aquaticus]QDL53610.1 MFS transporter [Rhodoferax aquaticus]